MRWQSTGRSCLANCEQQALPLGRSASAHSPHTALCAGALRQLGGCLFHTCFGKKLRPCLCACVRALVFSPPLWFALNRHVDAKPDVLKNWPSEARGRRRRLCCRAATVMRENESKAHSQVRNVIIRLHSLGQSGPTGLKIVASPHQRR